MTNFSDDALRELIAKEGGSIHPFLPYDPSQCQATKPSSDTGRWHCILPDAHKGVHRFLDSSIPNESDLDRTTLQDALRVCEDKAQRFNDMAVALQRFRIDNMEAGRTEGTISLPTPGERACRKDATTFAVAADTLRECLEALT